MLAVGRKKLGILSCRNNVTSENKSIGIRCVGKSECQEIVMSEKCRQTRKIIYVHLIDFELGASVYSIPIFLFRGKLRIISKPLRLF